MNFFLLLSSHPCKQLSINGCRNILKHLLVYGHHTSGPSMRGVISSAAPLTASGLASQQCSSEGHFTECFDFMSTPSTCWLVWSLTSRSQIRSNQVTFIYVAENRNHIASVGLQPVQWTTSVLRPAPFTNTSSCVRLFSVHSLPGVSVKVKIMNGKWRVEVLDYLLPSHLSGPQSESGWVTDWKQSSSRMLVQQTQFSAGIGFLVTTPARRSSSSALLADGGSSAAG